MNVQTGDHVEVGTGAGYRHAFEAVVQGEINHGNGEVTYILRDQHGGWHEVFGRYLTRK